MSVNFENLDINWLIKWKEALESGKWTSYRGTLHNFHNKDNEACCLGVLDELHLGIKEIGSYPTTYPEDFRLDRVIGHDIPKELGKQMNEYLDSNDIPVIFNPHQNTGGSLASSFACINDICLTKNLNGAKQYKHIISLLEMIIEYKTKNESVS